MKKTTPPAAPAAAAEPRATVCVAYHAGPPAITFGGREWRIDVAQEIPIDDWIRMNNRADFPEFDFREEP